MKAKRNAGWWAKVERGAIEKGAALPRTDKTNTKCLPGEASGSWVSSQDSVNTTRKHRGGGCFFRTSVDSKGIRWNQKDNLLYWRALKLRRKLTNLLREGIEGLAPLFTEPFPNLHLTSSSYMHKMSPGHQAMFQTRPVSAKGKLGAERAGNTKQWHKDPENSGLGCPPHTPSLPNGGLANVISQFINTSRDEVLCSTRWHISDKGDPDYSWS